MKVVEQRLQEMGKSRSDLMRDLKIGTNNLTNWKARGIPKGKILAIAKYISCQPEALEKGKFTPSEAENWPQNNKISQEAQDIALAYDFLPDSLKHHITIMVDDYVVSRARS